MGPRCGARFGAVTARPRLRLDELLAEMGHQLDEIVKTRDRMFGLLDAMLAVGSALELEPTLRRIVTATSPGQGGAKPTTGATGGAVAGPSPKLQHPLPVADLKAVQHFGQAAGRARVVLSEFTRTLTRVAGTSRAAHDLLTSLP